MEENEQMSTSFYEDYNLCKRCQKKTIDKSENQNSNLCKECRAELIRYPIPKIFYAAMAAIAVLMILSMLQFPDSLKNYKQYREAGALARTGYVYTALDNLVAVLEENPEATDVAVLLTDLAMEYGDYDYAAYTINTYLVDKEVSDREYNRINEYYNELDCYYNTCDAVETVFADANSMQEEEIIPHIEERLTTLTEDNQYQKSLLYFYLGLTADTPQKQVEYYNKAIETDQNLPEANAQLANYYRRNGEIDQAREILETSYNRNKEFWNTQRSMAILYLLDGKLEQGLELAKGAYEAYAEGDYVIDTYIVALGRNGFIKEAEQLRKEWEEKGYVFDKEMMQCAEGNYTLEEYYIDN